MEVDKENKSKISELERKLAKQEAKFVLTERDDKATISELKQEIVEKNAKLAFNDMLLAEVEDDLRVAKQMLRNAVSSLGRCSCIDQ